MTRWFFAGFVAAIAIAWLASLVHLSGRAPIGLVSLTVGAMLGATLTTLATMLRSPRRPGSRSLIIGAVTLALATVLAQHAWLYHDFRRQWHEARANSREAAMFRPESPWTPREYFEHELTPARAAIWLIDAALITIAATVMVILSQKSFRQTNSASPTPDP